MREAAGAEAARSVGVGVIIEDNFRSDMEEVMGERVSLVDAPKGDGVDHFGESSNRRQGQGVVVEVG